MKYNNLFNLQGKVVVVAGGAGLIGKELARGLAEMGAIVIVADIDIQNGSAYAKKLSGMGLNVFFKYLNITKAK